jgi:hypothetical protein
VVELAIADVVVGNIVEDRREVMGDTVVVASPAVLVVGETTTETVVGMLLGADTATVSGLATTGGPPCDTAKTHPGVTGMDSQVLISVPPFVMVGPLSGGDPCGAPELHGDSMITASQPGTQGHPATQNTWVQIRDAARQACFLTQGVVEESHVCSLSSFKLPSSSLHRNSLASPISYLDIISCEPLQNSSFPYSSSQNRLSHVRHRFAISNPSVTSMLVFS